MSSSRVGWLVGSLFIVVACGGSTQIEPGSDGGAGGGGRKATPIPAAGAPPASGGAPGTTRPEAGAPSVAGNSAQAGGLSETLCVLGDQIYSVGATWKCDCNTCGCGADGKIWSTLALCSACTYGEEPHYPGEKFPSTDGCNTCECTNDGGVACTEKACACNPDKEPNRQYAGKSPEQCAVIDYACSPPTKPFGNACGCGCEQDASCPEWINCIPGATDCAAMKQKCPLSKVAD